MDLNNKYFRYNSLITEEIFNNILFYCKKEYILDEGYSWTNYKDFKVYGFFRVVNRNFRVDNNKQGLTEQVSTEELLKNFGSTPSSTNFCVELTPENFYILGTFWNNQSENNCYKNYKSGYLHCKNNLDETVLSPQKLYLAANFHESNPRKSCPVMSYKDFLQDILQYYDKKLYILALCFEKYPVGCTYIPMYSDGEKYARQEYSNRVPSIVSTSPLKIDCGIGFCYVQKGTEDTWAETIEKTVKTSTKEESTKKWAVKVTKENESVVANWKDARHCTIGYYVMYPGYGNYTNSKGLPIKGYAVTSLPKDCIEITTEEFYNIIGHTPKEVLKEETSMLEKQMSKEEVEEYVKVHFPINSSYYPLYSSDGTSYDTVQKVEREIKWIEHYTEADVGVGYVYLYFKGKNLFATPVEIKPKVGDWVVVLPEDTCYHNCEQGIPQIVRNTLPSGAFSLQYSNGSSNSHYKVRLATSSEIYFRENSYIVTLIDSGYCGKTNYCFKQRVDNMQLSPVKDTTGSSTNGNSDFLAKDTSGNKWRFATKAEIQEYERRGKPYSIVEEKEEEKSPSLTPSEEELLERAKRDYPLYTVFDSTGGNTDCVVGPDTKIVFKDKKISVFTERGTLIGSLYNATLNRWAEIKKKGSKEEKILNVFKVHDIIVSLLEVGTVRKIGDIFEVLPKSQEDQLYYKEETFSSDSTSFRLATSEEAEAYDSGLRSIFEMFLPITESVTDKKSNQILIKVPKI